MKPQRGHAFTSEAGDIRENVQVATEAFRTLDGVAPDLLSLFHKLLDPKLERREDRVRKRRC